MQRSVNIKPDDKENTKMVINTGETKVMTMKEQITEESWNNKINYNGQKRRNGKMMRYQKE